MNISRVYKIINDCDDLVYIGSTTQILCKRMSNHRDDAKEEVKENYRNICEMQALNVFK